MANKQVAVFMGDDASPEVMAPTVDLLRGMDLGIDFVEPLVGQVAKNASGTLFPDEAKAQIDAADATFFGSTSGDSTPVLFYLRWGKQTFANLRPCVYVPGFNSPMARPDGIDFAIIRENLEDLYLGLEGDTQDLAGLHLYSRHARANLGDVSPGKHASNASTETGSARVSRIALERARPRDQQRQVNADTSATKSEAADGARIRGRPPRAGARGLAAAVDQSLAAVAARARVLRGGGELLDGRGGW